MVVFAAAFAALPTSLRAEETAAIKLLRDIRALQAEHGSHAPEALPPLLELGELWSYDRCEDAIEMLDIALEIGRRSEGLFSDGLLEIYEPLLRCYQTLDRPDGLKRAQHYVLLIEQSGVGANDPRLLPALDEGARRYEAGGLYLSARRLHRRAIEIVRRASGVRGRELPNDLRLVAPLRGMARAFRLEYRYALAWPDAAELETERSDLASQASFRYDLGVRVDPLGQRSLEQALDILRGHPDAQPTERLATLLELADWHQLAQRPREAFSAYREYWREFARVSPVPDTTGADDLRAPVPLVARPETGSNMRRPPLEPEAFTRYTVDVEFTVGRDGKAKDIRVVESNAPEKYQQEAVRDIALTRYRPRFESGEPVDTPGQHHRSNIYIRAPARVARATD